MLRERNGVAESLGLGVRNTRPYLCLYQDLRLSSELLAQELFAALLTYVLRCKVAI